MGFCIVKELCSNLTYFQQRKVYCVGRHKL